MFSIGIRCLAAGVLLFAAGACRGADAVALQLALPRSQYTTAEPIELAVLSKSEGGGARKLPLEVRHADGSSLTFQVPFDAPAGQGQTRLVVLSPGALRPGRYTAAVKGGGATIEFGVHRDRHPSGYFVGQWVHHGESRGTTLAKGGWMYMTSDLATLHPRRHKPGDLAEW